MILRRIIKVGDALSQLANTAFFLGHPNESISGRSYEKKWLLEKVINFLFLAFERDHCMKAYKNDIEYCIEKLKKSGYMVIKK